MIELEWTKKKVKCGWSMATEYAAARYRIIGSGSRWNLQGRSVMECPINTFSTVKRAKEAAQYDYELRACREG
jgi:hypothetical protein